MTLTQQPFEKIAQRIYPHSKLVRAWPLTGGISATVTAMEIERADGTREKLVVRQHGEADLQENPHIATDEFKLLVVLQSAGIAMPKPYLADESGDILPSPYIVGAFIDGETDFAPSDMHDYLAQMAEQLAHIHQIDVDSVPFLPDQAVVYGERLRNQPAQLDDSLQEGLIRARLEPMWPPPNHNRAMLVHGDYWPGNLLWKDGRVAAVIDWEDAKVGDPLGDVANARMEILWTFGQAAMDFFTEHYQKQMPLDFRNLPYWDLCMALRPAGKLSSWALDAATEARMREWHKAFVAQAMAKIGERD